MRSLLYFCVLLLINIKFTIGQNDSNKTYFPPLDIPLVLSANFGELRPNHFHMGLDFKTTDVYKKSQSAIKQIESRKEVIDSIVKNIQKFGF